MHLQLTVWPEHKVQASSWHDLYNIAVCLQSENGCSEVRVADSV